MIAQIIIVIIILLILAGMAGGGYYWYTHVRKPTCETGTVYDPTTNTCKTPENGGGNDGDGDDDGGSVPVIPVGGWSSVRTRPDDATDTIWSDNIYSLIVQDRKSNPQESGVGVNSKYLTGIDTLTQPIANNLCGSPCWWYGPPRDGKPSESRVDPNICNCKDGKAVNF